MHNRPAVSLFPLLSIFVGVAGVLVFLAMALALVGTGRGHISRATALVRPQWDGAPSYIHPVLLECRPDGVIFYAGKNAPPRFFSMARLRREAGIVRDLHERGTAQAGGALTRDQEWLFFKAVIERDQRLRDSLTLALHLVEIGNLNGDTKAKRDERYPIVLVSPDSLGSYELVTSLVDATSRLPVGVEPMLSGWSVDPAGDLSTVQGQGKPTADSPGHP